MGNWIPGTYLYVHGVFLACGFMAILLPQSVDAVLMMLATLGFSVLEDVLLLSLYEPRFPDIAPESLRNEFRFALGMCILNLIIKPFSGFILWRILIARNEDTAFTILGIESFPRFGGQQRGYENIDNKTGAIWS
ncbi:hypothetical protein C0Q70_08154 [Pomacea canaliculata]|uniref:Uncharacterized protein n=1 Tax=Pomacea canaliculata TaxID=400727 RepID=A0A2T7PH10_POMCA|nr:hypothetical protein C0Q70_08154 [Pomacea canaliculata]